MQSLTLFIEKRTIALCSDHLPLAIKKEALWASFFLHSEGETRTLDTAGMNRVL